MSHQVNTAMHCVHSNIQITGTILTANTTTDALHPHLKHPVSENIIVRRRGRPDVVNVTDMLIFFHIKKRTNGERVLVQAII